MAIIGEIIDTGERVVIVGPAMGMFRSESTMGPLGNLSPNIEEGREEWIYVSNAWGEISKREVGNIQIVEVDGTPIESLLAQRNVQNE